MAINNIVIRVDASAFIGSGHVMRCLNLADRFRAFGSTVVFVCRDYPKNMLKLIEERGYLCLLLEFCHKAEYVQQKISDDYTKWLWVSQQRDADDTINILSKNQIKPDLLVVDHYGLSLDWEIFLCRLNSKILVIDDIARKHECDYLLDQNYYINANQRYLNKVPLNCKLFLGPEYFLFSNEMLEQAKNIRRRTEIKKIFVFFGGADPQNYTLQVLQLAQMFPQLEFHTVIGSANQHYSLVLEFCNQHQNCFVHYNIDYMPRLINECDLGICAGGVNTWERILLNLPSIVYSVAENQEEICENLDNLGFIRYVGSCIDLLMLEKLLISLMGSLFVIMLRAINCNKIYVNNIVGEISSIL